MLKTVIEYEKSSRCSKNAPIIDVRTGWVTVIVSLKVLFWGRIRSYVYARE
jgi:hypothetical protein